MITVHHAKFFAHELTKRCSADSIEKLAGTLVDVQVDLNPHQVEAARRSTCAPSAMDDAAVVAKQEKAVAWCQNASDYAATYGGKPWQYVLIPHDAIAENMTLAGLVQRYGTSSNRMA